MPFIIALVTALGAVYFFVLRARNAADMTNELMDVADDIRAAARRFGFRRKYELHPVESIDDPKIAIAAIGYAFIQLDDLPSKEQQDALSSALRRTLNADADDAVELTVLGRWLVQECGDAQPAVSRIARKLARFDKGAHLNDLLAVLTASVSTNPGLNDKQRDAIADIQRAFKL